MAVAMVWVIEMEDGPGNWSPCMGLGLDRAEARRELEDWQRRNPSDNFRVRKYVREEKTK